ncbi:hypothetical protein FE257_007723 [Aspergillus nanangensis]|uniref:C2H2-type domain-containing protein n=1 Tax=Aspergillus nanangensis TaxID=2582783 RepID=A0AAD4GYS1_ASPNN|nr:hypothetical protein FE257_007723 [Aspergillus nanangensis]
MSPSSTNEPTWENSGDVLQGIMGSRIGPVPSQSDLTADGLTTSSELAPGDPASFLGFQFGPEPAVLPHHHASILNQWPLYHPSSPASQPLDYPHFHHSRLTNDQDAWNPLQVTGVPTNSSAFGMQYLGKPQPMNAFDRRCSTGHHSTPSENGSQCNGIHPSDSGYSSRSCTTRSVANSYAFDSAASPYLAPHEYEHDDRASALDLVSHYTETVLDTTENVDSPMLCHDIIRCDYPGCQWTGKCPSDKRKHEARHRKLFKCDIPNCTRKEGFGTINDLARHKKCVHKKEPERGPKVLYMSHDWYETCVKPQAMAHMSSPTNTQVVFEMDSTVKLSADEFEGSVLNGLVQPSDGLVQDHEEEEHKVLNINHMPPRPASQQPELSALNSLRLNSVDHEVAMVPPLAHPRNHDKMDDMVSEAAANMLNAMTKMINSNQRRRSHQTEDGEDVVSNSAELTGQKKEMLQKILSAALERLSGNSGPGQVNSSDLRESGPDQKGWIQCEFCSKRTRLRCEMKKHKKRHERPYGCTFDRCHKTFGSKADWKRHENSQHFHTQSWRCTLPDASQGGIQCFRLFYRQEIYVQHIKKHHQIANDDVRGALFKNRIGRNGQQQFWCGFCQAIVPLKNQGIEAWNERFNHIDAEHFKKGERIGNWLLPSGHFTKDRELEEERKRALAGVNGEGESLDDEGDPSDDEDDDDDDSSSSSYHSDCEVEPEDAMTIDTDAVRGLSAFTMGEPSVPLRAPTYTRKRKLPLSSQFVPGPEEYNEAGGSGMEKRSRVETSFSILPSQGIAVAPQSMDGSYLDIGPRGPDLWS